MALIKNKKKYFAAYNILESEFEYNEDLNWEELKDIYYDYEAFIKNENLEGLAGYQAIKLSKKCSKIHSHLHRVKNPEHLISKIIREKIKNINNTHISLDNYKTKIEDIIGIRLLHIFKRDWKEIHKIMNIDHSDMFQPYAYFRDGDDEEYISELNEQKIYLRRDKDGYRSIHYFKIIKEDLPSPVSCEIQVRTLFEEAWSEISHAIRYPNNQDNIFLRRYFKIYNRLSGTLDEMGNLVNETSYEINKKAINIVYTKENYLPTIILKTRKEYYEKAIQALDSTEAYYRSVIDGPYFLHPSWLFDLRDRYYEDLGDSRPNYDVKVASFVRRNMSNENSDIRFIVRNSKRYVSKLERIIPWEQREQFKIDIIENIDNLLLHHQEKNFKILCLNTGFISVTEIYKESALESDKKVETDPLTKGRLHQSIRFVEERKDFFDRIFDENYQNNQTSLNALKEFIKSLWIK